MASLFVVLLLAFKSTCGIFFFNKKKNREVDEESEQEYDHLLCKFVRDGSGRKIGESISIDDGIVIIKSKGRFLGVPLKHIEDRGKTLLVKGLVDFDKAYELGEKWRKNSFYELDKTEAAEGGNNGL